MNFYSQVQGHLISYPFTLFVVFSNNVKQRPEDIVSKIQSRSQMQDAEANKKKKKRIQNELPSSETSPQQAINITTTEAFSMVKKQSHAIVADRNNVDVESLRLPPGITITKVNNSLPESKSLSFCEHFYLQLGHTRWR
jgi:predicted Zn-dependent peptidase